MNRHKIRLQQPFFVFIFAIGVMRNIAILLVVCETFGSATFIQNPEVVKYLDFLAGVPFLSDLNYLDNAFVIDALEKCSFQRGKTIVEQGDEGAEFFIIVDAIANVYKNYKHVGALGRHDYFGELSLLLNQPRAATVVAATQLECVKLDKERFIRLMDIFNKLQVLERNFSKYSL